MLYDIDVRTSMKEKCTILHTENGADQIAKYLIKMITDS